MKKAIILITVTIIILFFTACVSQAVQEATMKDTAEPASPEVTTVLPSTPALTPESTICPSESPDDIIPPEETPTPYDFNVDDVKMQSTPGSSCFSEIGYDSYWEILVVQFRDNGSVYSYLDFPIDKWDKFISADSLGSWYNKYIKGQYEYEKIR